MTTWEFNTFLFYLKQLFSSCVTWATDLMFSCFSAFLFYVSCVCIFQFVRLICSPFIGFALYSGHSDSVKSSKRNGFSSNRQRRYYDSHIKGQRLLE